MVAAQSDAARWLQSRVRQRGGRSAVVAAQSDTARWLQRGIINVQILRHIGAVELALIKCDNRAPSDSYMLPRAVPVLGVHAD